MKKILFAAAIAATTLFASCAKDGVNGTPDAEQDLSTLTVRISGAAKANGSRAIEPAGTTPAIEITNGHIYIFNPSGAFIHSEDMDLTEANGATTANGQIVGVGTGSKTAPQYRFPADSRVYIMANFPSSLNPTNLKTFAQIEAAIAEIKHHQSNSTTPKGYNEVFLANSDGKLATITVTEKGKAKAEVSIKPLMSRMELHKVKASPLYKNGAGEDVVITGYTVKGVYIDSYDNAFTLTGVPAGERRELWQFTKAEAAQKYTDILNDLLGDENGTTGWPAASGIAAPASGVWAYQVTSCKLPRFIIHLTDINHTEGGIAQPTISDKYITVAGYSNVTEFERGKIYRVGAESGITFTLDDLGDTPNPKNLNLTVYVTVEDWVLVDAYPIL